MCTAAIGEEFGCGGDAWVAHAFGCALGAEPAPKIGAAATCAGAAWASTRSDMAVKPGCTIILALAPIICVNYHAAPVLAVV